MLKSVYRTKNSLLLETVLPKRAILQMPYKNDEGNYTFPEQRMSTEVTTRSAKLVFHDGRLYPIVASHSNLSPIPKVTRISPQLAGLLTGYFEAAAIPYISAFLEEHFPDAERPTITSSENSMVDEMEFVCNDYTQEQKELIVDVCLRISTLAFPISTHFLWSRISDGFYRLSFSDDSYQAYHHALDIREFSTLLFGGFRKDLTKALMKQNNMGGILWGASFSKIIPLDYIVTMFQKPVQMNDEMIHDLSPLAGYSQKTIQALMVNGVEDNVDFQMIEDALEMAPSVPQPERKFCTTWQELHDRSMGHYVMKINNNDELTFNDEFNALFAETELLGYSLKPLRKASEFVETGKVMDVCVGSMPYVRRAYTGVGYCFRLDNPDGMPYALAEVVKDNHERWTLREFKGQGNERLPSILHHELQTAINPYLNTRSNHA